MANLRVDFYESGIGDTILVTFPSGGVGLIDAHPSAHDSRPQIEKLVEGKHLHFVCLTHPHSDHGKDLISVLESHPTVDEFWHTIYDVPQLFYAIQETTNFPSSVREFAAKMNEDWGSFLTDVFGAVAGREDIRPHLLCSNLREEIIDGVEIHCLGPDESLQNDFFKAYQKKLTDPKADLPDCNLLSAILALKFGDSVVLLGADALRKNWASAAKHHAQRGLPKARVLKVPHHGARNAMGLQKKDSTYLDLCARSPKAASVLFAGDAKHPDVDVFEKLRKATDVYCLSNGTKTPAVLNPLKLQLPGARAVRPAKTCNPVVSFELDAVGNLTVLAGASCGMCPNSH